LAAWAHQLSAGAAAAGAVVAAGACAGGCVGAGAAGAGAEGATQAAMVLRTTIKERIVQNLGFIGSFSFEMRKDRAQPADDPLYL
jgi:hypothetical protein